MIEFAFDRVKICECDEDECDTWAESNTGTSPVETDEPIQFDEEGNPIEKDNNEYDKGGKVITSGK